MPGRVIVVPPRPAQLFEYSKLKYVKDTLQTGKVRLTRASEYLKMEGDSARQDDELRHKQTTPGGDTVTIVAANPTTGERGTPFHPKGPVNYTSLVPDHFLYCMATVWDPKLMAAFSGSQACLVINNVEAFCEQSRSRRGKVPRLGRHGRSG